ncbi:MAG: hypothetical protein JOS17DRAFT_763064 [Linnemannia elongata]|nr:MAG: hypothetical protein JOS17DRAFT_763064 [Linnemannia elongata]
MYGLNNNQDSEDYLLYCGAAPGPLAIGEMGLPPSIKMFQVPVGTALVSGTFTSSYVELAGGQQKIRVLENPQNIVSPCLQRNVQSSIIAPLNNTMFNQFDAVSVGFRENKDISQPKDVWVPMSVEVEPLLRVQYIKAVSLFFNSGFQSSITYDTIIGTYNNLKLDMSRIPQGNKKRIGWVKYDFTQNSWTLRNTNFTRGIIRDAGGIPFPLTVNGDDLSINPNISPNDFKILMKNADVIIDQTEFPDGKGTYSSVFTRWRALAGFPGVDDTPRVLDKRMVFSLDNTINKNGISDYQYRMPSRPDLLLRDLISVQYPNYNELYSKNYKTHFLNRNFQFDGPPDNSLGPDNCMDDPTAPVKYNSGDITVWPLEESFTGLAPPPPADGGGIYGVGGASQGDGASGSGKSKTTSIIIAVVCVAAVLGAAFAFAFYKWSRRAKEDRFIELEEEMNNEIPLN